MSLRHSGPCGRVAIEPKTSESDGVPRLRRQPPSDSTTGGDPSPGTDVTAIMTVPSPHPHSLLANNLQLHSREARPRRRASQKYARFQMLDENGTFQPARVYAAGQP